MVVHSVTFVINKFCVIFDCENCQKPCSCSNVDSTLLISYFFAALITRSPIFGGKISSFWGIFFRSRPASPQNRSRPRESASGQPPAPRRHGHERFSTACCRHATRATRSLRPARSNCPSVLQSSSAAPSLHLANGARSASTATKA